jgi:hypothetical protein
MEHKIRIAMKFMDECHRVAGKLMEEQAHVDIVMCNVLREISGLDVKMSQAIFYTLDSFKARCDMLQRVAGSADNPEVLAKTNELIKGCQKINNQRKKLAHSLITVSDPGPEGKLIAYNPKTYNPDKIEPLTEGYLKDRLQQANTGRKQAFAAYSELCDILEVPPTLST